MSILKLVSVYIIVLLFSSCKVEPEPIQFGTDDCSFCKMIIMDPKFGAETVTQKGKVYKFDDINCMINFNAEKAFKSEDIAHLLVINHAQAEKFIDVHNAFFLQSEEIRSPMNSKIAAFENENDLNEFKNKLDGSVLTWEELKSVFQ